MLWSRQHNSQLFSVLLLREVKLLRESEQRLLAEIATLNDIISKRSDDTGTASPSDNGATKQTVNVIISDPLASLMGVDGAGDDENEEHAKTIR